MTAGDPRPSLAYTPMHRRQILAIAVCIALNALDGFDVLAISIVAPLIVAEWNIDRASLGIVLSGELFGMALGSIFIGGLADRYGRRPTILACLLAVGFGMFATAAANSIATLVALRVLTGLGIGGMLASINAIVSEYASERRRPLVIAINLIGYPIGAIIGGSLSSILLAETREWQLVFILGGGFTLAAVPFVVMWLPESVQWLLNCRPRHALARINAVLRYLGQPEITRLPPVVGQVEGQMPRLSTAALFQPQHIRVTILLSAAYLAHIITFYYPLKWIPNIVVDLGYPPSAAAEVLVWANVGGGVGALLLGFLSQRFPLRNIILPAMILAFFCVTVFGFGLANLTQLSLVAAATGCFNNIALTGLYALLASVYSPQLRAGGTGFVIGIGRGGAVAAPIIAGLLFAKGAGLLMVSTAMGIGSLLAALLIALLHGPHQCQAETGGKDRIPTL